MGKKNGGPGAGRLGGYLAGMICYAGAVCLMARADLGVSPVTSIAHALTLMTGWSLGGAQLLVNLLLIGVQLLLLGRGFGKRGWLQLAASLLFSALIDLLAPLAGLLPAGTWPLRAGLLGCSLLLMSFGLALVALADLVMLPGDGVARAIALRWGLPFGRAKVMSDCGCVALTCGLSLGVLGRIASVSVGTVAAALSLGNLVRGWHRLLGARLERWMGKRTGAAGADETADPREREETAV